MKHSTLLLLLGTIFLTLGYTTESGEGISKIHLSGDLLIRNIPGESITLYSVANPTDVHEVGSITVEKNHDLATSGSWLYADQGEDLLVYDISSPSTPTLVSTIEEVFDHEIPDAMVTGSGREEITPENVRANRSRNGSDVGGMSGCGSGCGSDDRFMASNNSGSGGSGAGQGTGTGGSMTRFIVVDRTLYCVDGDRLRIFDISDPSSPTFMKTTTVENGLETVFRSGEYLFIGGRDGMYVYSLSDPTDPSPISIFRHRTACDPVVVDGDVAYVTLRDGTNCGNTLNQLEIVDISDIENPQLIRSIPMTGPHGLAARDGVVMVCDGSAGVAVLRTDRGAEATRCDAITGITAHDIIWEGDLAVVTAAEGFWLYDASDPCEMQPYGEIDFE